MGAIRIDNSGHNSNENQPGKDAKILKGKTAYLATMLRGASIRNPDQKSNFLLSTAILLEMAKLDKKDEKKDGQPGNNADEAAH